MVIQQYAPQPSATHLLRRSGLGLSLACVLAVTACGGGGTGTEGSTSTGTGTGTGTADSAASKVFVEASAILCSQRDANDVCAEPTSSRATTAQLLALQQSINGDRVRFNAIGVQSDNYQTFGSVASGLGVTQSQSNYALLEQPLVLGRAQVIESAVTYGFDSMVNTSAQKYRQGDSTLTLGLLWNAGTPFGIQRSAVYDKTAASSDGSGRIGVKDWPAFIGPLTDRTDAPADADVKYVGVVDIRAGDGSPVRTQSGPGLMGHLAWGSCPISLSLHVSDGKLTITDASCTDAQTQAVIKFSMAPLYLVGSRIAGQLGNEASIQIDAPSGGFVSIPSIEHTDVSFTSSKTAGAVYGKAAAGIVVVGADAKGRFFIAAQRQ